MAYGSQQFRARCNAAAEVIWWEDGDVWRRFPLVEATRGPAPALPPSAQYPTISDAVPCASGGHAVALATAMVSTAPPGPVAQSQQLRVAPKVHPPVRPQGAPPQNIPQSDVAGTPHTPGRPSAVQDAQGLVRSTSGAATVQQSSSQPSAPVVTNSGGTSSAAAHAVDAPGSPAHESAESGDEEEYMSPAFRRTQPAPAAAASPSAELCRAEPPCLQGNRKESGTFTRTNSNQPEGDPDAAPSVAAPPVGLSPKRGGASTPTRPPPTPSRFNTPKGGKSASNFNRTTSGKGPPGKAGVKAKGGGRPMVGKSPGSFMRNMSFVTGSRDARPTFSDMN